MCGRCFQISKKSWLRVLTGLYYKCQNLSNNQCEHLAEDAVELEGGKNMAKAEKAVPYLDVTILEDGTAVAEEGSETNY